MLGDAYQYLIKQFADDGGAKGGEFYKDVEKFAAVVPVSKIKENDYNLNISRYVDTTEEEEEVDIEGVLQEIRELKAKIAHTEEKLNGYLKELGFEVI